MKVHFIQHETYEAPGAFLEWARARGCTITFSLVFRHEAVPETASGIDLLIILGGPQSPDTTRETCPYFDADAETALIRDAFDSGKAVVGVCLGAQLIGAALGAGHRRSPEKEIGVFPVHLTGEGLRDAKLSHFGTVLPVGHWHNDMPGLTPGSKVLATSAGCPRQIIRYSDRVYGFQCHMELTRTAVALLIAAEGSVKEDSSRYRFVQDPEEMLACDYRTMNHKLHQFLDKLVACMKP